MIRAIDTTRVEHEKRQRKTMLLGSGSDTMQRSILISGIGHPSEMPGAPPWHNGRPIRPGFVESRQPMVLCILCGTETKGPGIERSRDMLGAINDTVGSHWLGWLRSRGAGDGLASDKQI